MSTTATTVAIVAAVRNRYIRVFKKQSAITPQTAIVPEEFGLRRHLIFKKLVRDSVLIEVAHNQFYLDEEREKELKMRRRKIASVMLIIVALILLAILIGRFS